jgi:hypothetical protein
VAGLARRPIPLVEGLSWTTMLADYDLTAGRIWLLVPLWTLVLPTAVRLAQTRQADRAVR